MAAPALSIPVRANLDAFKKQMEETSSLARTGARKVAQAFLEANKEIASGVVDAAFLKAGAGALRFAGQIALVAGAAKLMGDAIGAARDQLKEMVEIADKSQNLGVSPSFLQGFTAESKKLQVGVEELEGALSHAFNATKDKPPIDLAEWDTGKDKITEVERALRVYNATLAKSAGQQLQGLVLFRDADTQEKKIEAVLKAMIQLESIGQKAAALDLGEKMFGSQLVDRIRQGRTSAESMLATVQKAAVSSEGLFPDVLVKRAKEMDDQLKVAHQRLSTALKPSWDDLAEVLLTIKGYWSTTVDLIAQAVELSNRLRIPGIVGASATDVDAKRSALAQVNARLNGTEGAGITGLIDMPALDIPGLGRVIDSTKERLERWRDELQQEIAALEKGEQYGPPKPGSSRGAGAAPTRRPTDTGGRDRLETGIDNIEKRTAALKAEAETIELGTVARERARIVAQLETIAKQANAAAGKGENVVTEDQRKHIEEVANAYAKAADAAQRAKIMADIKFDKATAWLTQDDVEIARALRDTYPDVTTALNSVEAAGMRAARGMREISSLGQDVNRGLFVQFGQNLRNGMNSWDAFRNAAVNALGRIQDKLLEMIADQLWKKAFGGVGDSLLSMLGIGGGSYGAPGTTLIGPPAPGASIAAMNYSADRYVQPANFVTTAGMNTSLASNKSAAASADSAPRVTVSIKNYSGAAVEHQQSSQSGVDIHEIVIGSIKRGTAGGELDDVMGRFGASPGTRRR